MKRRLLLFLLALVASFCLVFGIACSVGSESGNDGDDTATEQTPSENGESQTSDDGEEQDSPESDLTPTEGLEYTLSDDGTYYIVSGIGTANDTDIVIASTYEGLPVKEIQGGDLYNEGYGAAFIYCETITSVVISDSVTTIGDFAFMGCTSLKSITITDSVTAIGDGAFAFCTSLTSITIPDSVTTIGMAAFGLCTALTDIIIPDGVTSIGEQTFYNCTSLKSITIGEGVTSIGEQTFYNCTSLESIIIPDGVITIGDFAFFRCTLLESVYYAGTSAEEWGNISIGSSNDLLNNATIYYYSENEPDMNDEGTAYDGNHWYYGDDGEIIVWVYTVAAGNADGQ